MKTNNSNFTWEEIEKYLEKDTYREFLKHISPSVFKMAKDENNRERITEIVLKVLRERDPQNATEDYAQKIFDAMWKVAIKISEK